jgi:hypothetical protein
MKTQKPHTRAFDLDAATAAGALARLVHKLFVAVRVSCACLVLSGRKPSVSQLQHSEPILPPGDNRWYLASCCCCCAVQEWPLAIKLYKILL